MFIFMFFFVFNFFFAESNENNFDGGNKENKINFELKFNVENSNIFKLKINEKEVNFDLRGFLKNFSKTKEEFFKTSFYKEIENHKDLIEEINKAKSLLDKKLEEGGKFYNEKFLILREKLIFELEKNKNFFFSNEEANFSLDEFILNILNNFILDIKN